jgi:hypothetical protein
MTLREAERRRALLTGIAPVHHPAQQPSITQDPAIKAVPVQRRPEISARGKPRNRHRHQNRRRDGDDDSGDDGGDGGREPYDPELRKVMLWATFLERNKLSKPSGWRLRKQGLGPKIVMLGKRRMGVTFAAERDWQESRTGA